MKYPIDNGCLKVSIDGHSKSQLVPKFLLQVSVQEIHNSMVSPPEEGGLMETIYVDNYIIIINSMLSNIMIPKLKNMSEGKKVMCACDCCISAKSMHS